MRAVFDMPTMRLALLLCGLGAGGAGAQRAERTAVLRVLIRDSAGKGIPYASLTIPGQGYTFSAGAGGRVAAIRLIPGQYLLHARAIGYRTDSLSIFLGADETRAAEMPLAHSAQRLADLEAKADPIAAFYRRVRITGGKMITREAIERSGAIFTFDALEGVLNFRVHHVPLSLGGPIVDLRGCGSQSKAIGVWLNGRQLGRSPYPVGELWEALNITRATEIELIEVYRRYDEIPPGFRDANACAALAIWTTDYLRTEPKTPGIR